MPIKLLVKFWLPVLLCMGLIFYASSICGDNLPPLFSFQDIAFHLLIYSVLAYFFSRALKFTYVDITTPKIIFWTIIFVIIYGITDELHQTFVPMRTMSGMDIFIDGIGSFLGSLFFMVGNLDGKDKAF